MSKKKKLAKRILKSKGVFIFLGAVVVIAAFLMIRSGLGNSRANGEEVDGTSISPITFTEEPPSTQGDVVINTTTTTAVEKSEETQATPSAETTAAETAAQTTAKTAAQTAEPSQTWTETKINSTVMYVNTNGISSREKPIQGSKKVKSHTLNEEVTVVAKTSTSYYKTSDGSFIHSDYLSANKQADPTWKETDITPRQMYVNTAGVSSREIPIQGSKKINKLEKGQAVTVVATTNTDYYKAQDGSYIHKDYLDEKKPETVPDTTTTTPVAQPDEWKETAITPAAMYVNTDGAYSRKKAIQGSERLNKLTLNQQVTVIAQTDTEYYKLQEGGYVHKDYLTDKNPNPPANNGEWTETALPAAIQMRVNSNNVSSRIKPIQGSTKVNALNKDQLVTVVARTNTSYYKLQDGSYVHTDYLSVLQGEQTTGAVTNPPEGTTAAETTKEPEVVVRSLGSGQRSQEQWEIDYCNQLFDLTNQVREENGLSPLEKLDSLSAAAVTRAWESTKYNSHTRPDGTSCFTVLTDYGLKLSGRGENLAVWHSTPQKALNSWLNNAAHRNIILNPDFKYMGVGFYYVSDDTKGNYYYWEQLFYAP